MVGTAHRTWVHAHAEYRESMPRDRESMPADRESVPDGREGWRPTGQFSGRSGNSYVAARVSPRAWATLKWPMSMKP